MRPWSGRDSISTIGACGDDDVPDDIMKATLCERVMDSWVADRLIDLTAAKDAKKTKATLRRELEGLAAELAGPNPTSMELLLAETAALAWFSLRMHEAHFLRASTSEEGLTIQLSDHHQRRIDRAHRRLMATLRTLATVRRLGVPAIQVNVAPRQVNIAGSTS
jgi:hypothetical protein